MANNRIVRYVTNTALLAVLAAAGIGVYQLGTIGTDVEIQEEHHHTWMTRQIPKRMRIQQ